MWSLLCIPPLAAMAVSDLRSRRIGMVHLVIFGITLLAASLIERHIIKQSEYPGLVNRIKIMSNLDISEKRLPQDGRIMYCHGEIKFDIRTSVMPVNHGEKIVMRLLARGGRHLTLDELGLDKRQMDDYVASISRPHGLILISGPTGSGKSTTLYATLERLNRVDNNILF